jgi:hypothetical protein
MNIGGVMIFYNKENAVVPLGARESVHPFSLTRDITDEEIEKSPELRNAIRVQKYLVPYDRGQHAVRSSQSQTRKVNYQIAPDNQGGERKTVQKGSTKVEYIVADGEGVDGISSPDSGVIAAIPGEKPVDFIEPSLDAGKLAAEAEKSPEKPIYRSASEAFEAEIAEEQEQDIDFDDESLLTEQDRNDERNEKPIPDAEEEIANDFKRTFQKGPPVKIEVTKEGVETLEVGRTSAPDASKEVPAVHKDPAPAVTANPFEPKAEIAKEVSAEEADPDEYSTIIKQEGNMGATETTVKEEVFKAQGEATAKLAEAAAQDYDDNEHVSGASDEIARFLSQPFDAKKWVISKETNQEFLGQVAAVTKSENVKGLVSQRMSELEG